MCQINSVNSDEKTPTKHSRRRRGRRRDPSGRVETSGGIKVCSKKHGPLECQRVYHLGGAIANANGARVVRRLNTAVGNEPLVNSART